MKKIDYSMRFQGQGAPTNAAGTELSAASTGKSCSFASSVGTIFLK